MSLNNNPVGRVARHYLRSRDRGGLRLRAKQDDRDFISKVLGMAGPYIPIHFTDSLDVFSASNAHGAISLASVPIPVLFLHFEDPESPGKFHEGWIEREEGILEFLEGIKPKTPEIFTEKS